MLDECANRCGQHFGIMSLSLLARFVATQTPGMVDDCGHRHADALPCEAIPQGRVVVAGDRQSLILDHRSLSTVADVLPGVTLLWDTEEASGS